jgi:hypothetical protein
MTVTFGRTDTSVLGRWWWTVDRWTIAALFLLVAVGALLTMAASPAVAERIGALMYLRGDVAPARGNVTYVVDKSNGYRVISNVGEDAGQTVKHLHFHVLGGEKLPV